MASVAGSDVFGDGEHGSKKRVAMLDVSHARPARPGQNKKHATALHRSSFFLFFERPATRVRFTQSYILHSRIDLRSAFIFFYLLVEARRKMVKFKVRNCIVVSYAHTFKTF